MYTKKDFIQQIKEMGISPFDTLLVHSSMKAIGQAENQAETVLDAFIEYMKDGLLVFPTHTWKQMNDEYNTFNPETEPSCVGILSNLFMKRPGVFRSLHPTHSVAAIGKDAQEFIKGEEKWDTPCPREGCWGKLYDRKAKILFMGCTLKCNTILHGVEEWLNIPDRLSDNYQHLKIAFPDGRIIDRPLRRHHSVHGRISDNYDKVEAVLFHKGIARSGQIGDAYSILCDCDKMVDLVSLFLLSKPDLFSDNDPLPFYWYV